MNTDHKIFTSIALIAFLLMAGCAAKKKKPAAPAATYVVPVACMDKVVSATTKTKCYAVDAAHPDLAQCGPLLVHFTCTAISRTPVQK